MAPTCAAELLGKHSSASWDPSSQTSQTPRMASDNFAIESLVPSRGEPRRQQHADSAYSVGSESTLDMPWFGCDELPQEGSVQCSEHRPQEFGSEVFDEFFERCSLGSMQDIISMAINEESAPVETAAASENSPARVMKEVPPAEVIHSPAIKLEVATKEEAEPAQVPPPNAAIKLEVATKEEPEPAHAPVAPVERPTVKAAQRAVWKCLYCGNCKVSSSLARDGRTRIRCNCGGKFGDGQERLHANWQQQPADAD